MPMRRMSRPMETFRSFIGCIFSHPRPFFRNYFAQARSSWTCVAFTLTPREPRLVLRSGVTPAKDDAARLVTHNAPLMHDETRTESLRAEIRRLGPWHQDFEIAP